MRTLSIYQTVPVAGALLLAVWAGAGLPKAHACSTPAPEPDFGWGEPSDNATDVPTDVILYYPIPIAALTEDGVPGTFTLKTMDEVEVAITARRVHYWNYELVPAEALAPNTAYELTGSWMVGTEAVAKTIRFTTGAGPLEDAPAAPSAMLEHYQVMSGTGSSCDPPPSGTCLSFGSRDLMVEHAYVDNFGQVSEPYLTRGSAMLNLSGIDQGTPFECVRLRTRAMNGTYSEPLMLCRADGPLTQLTSTDLGCTAEGLISASTPMDFGVPDAGGADTGEPIADGDVSRPSDADAAVPDDLPRVDEPRIDDGAGEESGTMEPQGAPAAASSAGCSAVRSTTHRTWALAGSLVLVGLLVRRRFATSRRASAR